MSGWERLDVDADGLQKYLDRKKDTLMLSSAYERLKHTLEPYGGTVCHDGLLRAGDSFRLESAVGCLHADATTLGSHACPSLASREPLPTVRLTAKPARFSTLRSCFSATYVEDTPDVLVRYGRPVRLHGSLELTAELGVRPFYLYWTRGFGAPVLFPRASTQAVWRFEPPDSSACRTKAGQPVRVSEPFVLVHEATGAVLGAHPENTVPTTYGSELAIVAEEVDAEKRHLFAVRMDQSAPTPTAREHERAAELDEDPIQEEPEQPAVDMEKYAGLSVLIERLKACGLHGVRSLRRMCASMDFLRDGTVQARSFEGALSWLGIHLGPVVFKELVEVLEVSPGSGVLAYEQFLRLVRPPISGHRALAVRDAFRHLQLGGVVEVDALYQRSDVTVLRSFYPDLSDGELLESFLAAWDVQGCDGSVAWEEFHGYYSDVSLTCDSDEQFIELVRRTWRM